MRYELTLADGRWVTGVFPNLEVHQPRLLYHRHFMLSEKVAGPAGAPWICDWPLSYAAHLAARHSATDVRLTFIRHNLPLPADVLGGMRLDDERLYEEVEIFPVNRR